MPYMKITDIKEARSRLRAVLFRQDQDEVGYEITKYEIEKVLELLPQIREEKRGKYIRPVRRI